jgi:superfamily II DNA or RNA helicase
MERKYLANLNFEILNSERNNSSNSDFYRNLHESVLTECVNILSRRENTIIFAESKSHAIALNLYLRHNNIENELIVGETHPTKRKEYLSRFGSKDDSLSILVNHQILSTGIDVPGMNSIMILSIINSPTLALQIIGRAMRGKLNGGNETNTIYLTRDNQNKLQEYKILENQVLRN